MFKSMLVPVDLSHPEYAANAIAAAKALVEQSGGKLRLVTVVEPFQPAVASYIPEGARVELLDETRDQLRKMAEATGLGDRVTSSLREGSIYHEILAEAEACGADLVVMGSHRPEMSTYLFGSNAARVVRHAECSVLVVR